MNAGLGRNLSGESESRASGFESRRRAAVLCGLHSLANGRRVRDTFHIGRWLPSMPVRCWNRDVTLPAKFAGRRDHSGHSAHSLLLTDFP